MKNKLIKSTLILSIATLLSKILGSVFRIPLQNIAGDEVVGIFSLVYPVYMVALTLSVAGIPVAISKLISEANARKNQDDIYKIYRTALVLSIAFGITSFLFIYSFSGPISGLLGGESVRLSLIVVSATLLIAPYMAVYRGYFQGFENMNPTAISQVVEQLIRVVLILSIAYYLVNKAYSPDIISAGVMISSFVGALVSFFYLRYLFAKSPLKPKKAQTFTMKDFTQMSKKILRISLPICIGAITMALINFVDSVTIPMSLIRSGSLEEEVPYLYGIYSRGIVLVQIATVFSSSIVLPLIPLISKSIAQKDFMKVGTLIEKTHYYAHLISWPAAIGMFALTLPINLALFKDLQGNDILAVFSLSAVFMSLSILGTGILQGMNKEGMAARIIIGSVILKIVTNFLFIHWLGLLGAAYSTLFVYLVIFIINTYFIWKSRPFAFWKKGYTSIVVSSLFMGLAVGLPTLAWDFTAWSRLTTLLYLFVSILIGGIVYVVLLLVTKGINREEVFGLPIIKKILRKRT